MNRVVQGEVPELNSGTVIDLDYIRHALDLAMNGAGRTDPNPLVGAVVVQDGEVVGEGYHAARGQAHAECMALAAAGERAEGATLYVTLEPCSHHGRTPPCADQVISSGVKRVVVATADPDARVSGAGLERLHTAGLEVVVGCGAAAAYTVNMPYFKRHLALGTAVTLKMAMTLDGKISSRPGVREAITGDDTQLFVHELRAQHKAVLVGANTVAIDAPRLDCRRLREVAQPVPVVLDSGGRTADYTGWAGRRSLRLVRAGDERPATQGEVELLVCDGNERGVCVDDAARQLSAAGLDSVLVEGGAGVFTSFLLGGCWDVMHVLVAPFMAGDDGVPLVTEAVAVDASPVATRRLGRDVLITYLRGETKQALDAHFSKYVYRHR